jgi:dipeptidyl aminopeptidase/acylaminoacyl peptidase
MPRIRKVVLSLLCSAAAVALLGAAAPEAAAPKKAAESPRRVKQYTIEQFMGSTRITGASFSADESRLLFSSNKTDIFNVYSVSVSGGEPVPMTTSKTDTTFAVSYFPTDERFLYTRDQGGNELNHLYVREKDGSERDLTPGEKLKAQFAGWTIPGDAFYVKTNERDPRFFDLYRYDAKTYERTLLYKDETGYELGAISDDGKWIAFAKPLGTSDSDIYLWNTVTSQMKHLTPHQGQADHAPEDFDPESKALYYLTNDGSEFKRVRKYDLATGQHEDVEKPDWDVQYTYFSRKGKYRVTGINNDGRTVIKVVEPATGKPVQLPKLPEGDITSLQISRSERKISFYVNGDRSPNNLWVYEFGAPSARRLTSSLNPQIDPQDLVDSEVVRFKSFDGTTVPSIFFKPQGATPENKVPALVWVHGGPGGQTRKGYSAGIQYLANRGYAVLGINNRGSSGYGKTFYMADDMKHGKEPLWDCVEGKKYLASLPYVDPNRIGIIGGSYGGYMVLAALAYKPEEFAVGVDIFGVSNWLRTLESIPKWWESFRLALYKEMGDPEKDKEMLREISPVFHADKIRRPLFVVQGANDPRVLKAESDDIVAAAKKNGVPVEYVVFPDEGHGFTKRANEITAWKSIGEFLERHLSGPDKPARN